jgi:hypothetical protein
MLERIVEGMVGTEFGIEVAKNADPDRVTHGAYCSRMVLADSIE